MISTFWSFLQIHSAHFAISAEWSTLVTFYLVYLSVSTCQSFVVVSNHLSVHYDNIMLPSCWHLWSMVIMSERRRGHGNPVCWCVCYTWGMWNDIQSDVPGGLALSFVTDMKIYVCHWQVSMLYGWIYPIAQQHRTNQWLSTRLQ